MKRFLFLSLLMCGIASGALFAQGVMSKNVANPTGYNYILDGEEYTCVNGETNDLDCGSGSQVTCTFTHPTAGTLEARESCTPQEEGAPILGAIMKRNSN